MLVMARLGSITRVIKVSSVGLLIASILVLSGCSVVDTINPAIENDDRMQIDPHNVVVDFPDAQVNVNGTTTAGDVLSGGSSNVASSEIVTTDPTDPTTYPELSNWTDENGDVNSAIVYTNTNKLIVEPDLFPELTSTQMNHSDYADYLNTCVYEPMQDLLNELDSKDKSQLYFRIASSGYDYDSLTGEMTPASSFNKVISGAGSRLDGTATWELMWAIACQNPKNVELLSSTRTTITNKAKNYMTSNNPPDGFSDWGAVDYLGLSSVSDFPKDVMSMAGNERFSYSTLQDYLNKLSSSELIGVIPDFKFQWYVGSSNATNVTMNVSNSSGARYVDYITKTNIGTLCSSFNQFSFRKCSKVDKVYVSTGSLVYGYVDGYTKTIVILATNAGTELLDFLSDAELLSMMAIMNNIKNVTQWNDIVKAYNQIGADVPSYVVIPAGTKGTS